MIWRGDRRARMLWLNSGFYQPGSTYSPSNFRPVTKREMTSLKNCKLNYGRKGSHLWGFSFTDITQIPCFLPKCIKVPTLAPGRHLKSFDMHHECGRQQTKSLSGLLGVRDRQMTHLSLTVSICRNTISRESRGTEFLPTRG